MFWFPEPIRLTERGPACGVIVNRDTSCGLAQVVSSQNFTSSWLMQAHEQTQ